ncbi:MAG: hypothetical protein AAF738_05100 [Bacteroidota bacterium]
MKKRKKRRAIGCGCVKKGYCSCQDAHSDDAVGMLPSLKTYKKKLKNQRVTVDGEFLGGIAVGVVSSGVVSGVGTDLLAGSIENANARRAILGVGKAVGGAGLFTSKSDFLKGVGVGWLAGGASDLLEAADIPDRISTLLTPAVQGVAYSQLYRGGMPSEAVSKSRLI